MNSTQCQYASAMAWQPLGYPSMYTGPYQQAGAISSPYTTPTGIGSSKRRTRTVFDNQAVCYLESQFKQDAYPDYDTRCFYASRLGVSEDRIQVWFQNKRSRSRGKKLPRGIKSGKQPRSCVTTPDSSDSPAVNSTCSTPLSHASDVSGYINEPAAKRFKTQDGSLLSTPTNDMIATRSDYNTPPSDTSSTDMSSYASRYLHPSADSSVTLPDSSADDVFTDSIPAHQAYPPQPKQQSISHQSSAHPIQRNVFQFPTPLNRQKPVEASTAKKRPSSLRLDSLDLPLSTPNFLSNFSPLWNVPFSPLYLPSPSFNLPKPGV